MKLKTERIAIRSTALQSRDLGFDGFQYLKKILENRASNQSFSEPIDFV